MHTSKLISAVLCYLALAVAWPWPPTIHYQSNKALGRRADNHNGLLERAPAAAATATASKAAATSKAAASTHASAKASGTKASGTKASGTKVSGSAAATTAAKSGAKTSGKASATQTYYQDGGFSMMTPAHATPTYGKIGAEITFVWNYTSLAVKPSAVDVIASNTDGGVWTIASNMSVKQTGSVVWNTSNLATPLPMESYTFVIFDSHAGITAVPSPGHLSPAIGYPFAMYSPQVAVAGDAYYCVTCNAAVASIARQSLAVLFGTCLLTILSFTYFSCGFLGVW